MNWHALTELRQLDEIDAISRQKPVMIYKHSTRCGVSLRMQSILEKTWKNEDEALFEVWHLDLLSHRVISDAIAQRYGVDHESPQILLIRNGASILDASHHFIDLDEVRKTAAAQS